jgi:Putative beta-barrel porin-2, OmpL-like. bbp2
MLIDLVARRASLLIAALALLLGVAPALRAQQAGTAPPPAASNGGPTDGSAGGGSGDAPVTAAEAQARLAAAQKQLAEAQAQLAQAVAQAQAAQTQAQQAAQAAQAAQAQAQQAARAAEAAQAQAAQVQPTTPAASGKAATGIAEAATTPDAKPKAPDPFAFGDFTWLNGNSRASYSPIDTKAFTAEFRVDTSYIYDYNHPKDDTLDGTSESGRTGEVQVQQLGIGGDFHYDNVIGRLMTQFGMYSTMTPRNDASPSKGQWDLADAYRYLSEAYGGYHLDVMNGINIEAGIFMSYVGLFSYYNYDNWAYQPSYVSSNTPWFFNGLRVQIFPSDKLKIEPWFINGWQSYGRFNSKPGLGMQVLWRPTSALEVLSNSYGVGTDTLGNPERSRWHSDDSVELKYYDKPGRFVDKSALSFTFDAGCESGGGVHCLHGTPGQPTQYFLGYMLYDRVWFDRDRFAVTLGGGQITNPGRYLVLLPPINGATAASGTPYFTENPGQQFRAYDGTFTFDYMPSQFITFRTELDRRGASVPYFVGPGGITPAGGNTGAPGSLVPGFTPDLRKTETRINTAILVKF